ncbi:MAG: GAF domain-containing sensor histidine kinase [Chloroflexota bacterium]|nr:GAF domain-containing sensor histidine kinase [Chloroflexota bacterium]
MAAEYAALGIVDEAGLITKFVTSGISTEERRAIGDLPRGHGLLGLIIRENRSYRIPNIASHPESYGFPPNHPPMASFLGAPATVRGEVVGRLYLTNKRNAEEFSADDQTLVETFALHAAIAIDNARLYGQVKRLAVVGEQDRISRDLHDSVIQSIYAVTLALDDVPELVSEANIEASRRVDDAIDALHAVIRDIRNFIFGLRPLLELGSLLDGLRTLADELSRNTTTETDVVGDEPKDISIEVVAELLAIAREALANVARHSGATHASIRLAMSDNGVRLEIIDNGLGFEPKVLVARGHHGLANMRARAEGLMGTFEIESAASGGTRIIVVIPRTATRRGANQ